MTDNEWTGTEEIKRMLLAEPEGIAPLRADDAEMRVVVGVPMERSLMQEAFFGFVGIFQQGWPYARLAYTRNDIARHKMAKFLLGSNYTHLLMLDSDHVHPADIVPRLARWFQAYPEVVHIVAGLNFRRGEPYDPCAFVDPGDGTFHRMAEWKRGAIEVDALGTGSMMISRAVFETLPEDVGWFDYDYPNHEGWPGTDMAFSAKCREQGIKLWCDTTTTSPHIGTQLIDEGTYRAWVAAQQEQDA